MTDRSIALPLGAAIAVIIFYAVLGLVILIPEAVYSGDIGLKFVQARALAANGFASLAIPYPGAVVDPSGALFPLEAPFVFTVQGEPQSIFSPAAAILQAPAAAAAGIRGLTLISVLSGAVVLFSAMALVGHEDRTAVAIVLGLGSPMWFYAVNGWEHAPAVACSTAAFAIATRARGTRAALAAGLLVGAGSTLRDEVLLVLPGLLAVLWWRERSAWRTAAACAGAVVPLLLAGVIDVALFERPAAAHLRHAVHMVQSALHLTSEPNLEIPSLEPFTLRDRYEAVVNYWLFGATPNVLILALTAGVLVAAVAHRFRWSWPAALVVGAVCVAAVIDTVDVLIAPRWLAGLLHLAPYSIFAVLPRPATGRSPWPLLVLITTAAYLLIAFAGVDTSGGKSLGPRLLLPLVPLLTTAAIVQVRAYSRSPSAVQRATGWMGVALCILALTLHLGGAVPAYHGRNAEDGAALQLARDAREPILVADDPFTAQLFLPLYYRKILLLADSPEEANALARALVERRVTGGVLLVSRFPAPAVGLEPLHIQEIWRIGRMTVQYWK